MPDPRLRISCRFSTIGLFRLAFPVSVVPEAANTEPAEVEEIRLDPVMVRIPGGEFEIGREGFTEFDPHQRRIVSPIRKCTR